jgi:threonine dehydrogenase-like Zn-dependent dehydrogenase
VTAARALREAILSCRNGGTISLIGVYGGFVDKFPAGALMNRSLTIKTGQTHVQRYMRPLFERIQQGDIDPSFVIAHRLRLDEAPDGYEMAGGGAAGLTFPTTDPILPSVHRRPGGPSEGRLRLVPLGRAGGSDRRASPAR